MPAIVSLLAAFAATAAEPLKPGNVVILGDSISAGYGVDPDEAFPALLQGKVEKAGLPFKVVNAGVSGDTTAGGLRRLDWIMKQPIDVLVVELGGNDGLRGVGTEETKSNLGKIVQKAQAKYPQASILIAGMKLPANMGEDYRTKFEASFSEVAKETGVGLIPFVLEGVGGSAELNQPDRIHPTAAGHKIVAETVWKQLEPLLKSKISAKQ